MFQEWWEFFKELINPQSIIHYGGLGLLLLVVFAETGLLIGFFLPGDSLLFTAGLFTATGVIDLPVAVVAGSIIAAAVFGDFVGYHFGKSVGPALYKRKRSFFFRPNHLIAAKEFYEKHGAKAIVLGRFLPIVRTFAPIVAGIVGLQYRNFVLYNITGAIIWTLSMVLSGYFLGVYIPATADYLEYIIIGLVVITTIPIFRTWLKSRKTKN